MVFSSVPVYLDPPNWPNPLHHHQQGDHGVIDPSHEISNNNSNISNNNSNNSNNYNSALLPPAAAAGGGATRPGSMTERARMAKIPMPEAALKCPRCESTNTKFCYFNNYSLSQPRHFCKTCRRYWTRGGALRNVPVGGGCRRNNKRSKSARSKSPAGRPAETQTGPGSSTTNNMPPSNCNSALMSNLPPLSGQIPFLPPIQTPDLGLGFGGTEMEFGNSGLNLSARFADLFRLQHGLSTQHQLPFLAGMDQPAASAGLYQFEADQYAALDHQLGSNSINVKLEVNGNNSNGLNLSRNYDNHQFWNNNNSSITTRNLMISDTSIINGLTTDLPSYASSTSRLL